MLIISFSPVSTTGTQTLDYCTYYEAGKLGVGAMKVVPKFKTDHNMVVISFQVRPKPKY